MHDRARRHEVDQLAEEAAGLVLAIEAFGLGARQADALLGDDAQAGLLEHGVDRAGEVTLGGVRLDDGEGALDGHVVFLRTGLWGAFKPLNRVRRPLYPPEPAPPTGAYGLLADAAGGSVPQMQEGLMAGDNSQQIREWNGAVGAHWVTQQETMDRPDPPVRRSAAIRAATFRPGERVLDIGWVWRYLAGPGSRRGPWRRGGRPRRFRTDA